jgi:hypothetical protein
MIHDKKPRQALELSLGNKAVFVFSSMLRLCSRTSLM